MKAKDETGAIVVEATISFTTFIFVIFTILSVLNICFIQAKISSALNSAAKEISEYTFLYYKMGINDVESNLADGTEDDEELVKNTISGTMTFFDGLSKAEGDVQASIESGSIDWDVLKQDKEDVVNGAKNMGDILKQYQEKIKENPKGFFVSMGMLAATEGMEELKVILAQIMARAFMEANLQEFVGDTADDFLARYNVVDAMDGLDFNYSSLMSKGSTDDIQLVVTYDVKVIQLLNIDFTFTFRQMAKTKSWGNGVSAINPATPGDTPQTSSIWDLESKMRGRKIVEMQKKEYPYSLERKGADAYDNSDGKNQFVYITSIDTTKGTYLEDPSGVVKKRLNASFNDMNSHVSKMGESISMKNEDGEIVDVESPVETRTYKIEIVVPESTDKSVIHGCITEFVAAKKANGYKVSVVIVDKYGDPTPDNEETDDES